MNRLILAFILFCIPFVSAAQFQHKQYFDGADTSASNSIIVTLDPAPSNIWQVGKPQKTVFKSAATVPNVIVTDTLNDYPQNNISRFYLYLAPSPNWYGGTAALQWMQKLEMSNLGSTGDGGVIEFSVNSTNNWQNAFVSPYVYNFYGFNPSNVVTLTSGEKAFGGIDTLWRNIWLCFQTTWMNPTDTIKFRFTFKSDALIDNRDGWMLDNFSGGITIHHTAKGPREQEEYLRVYPALTTGIVNIEAQKQMEFHVIESIEVMGIEGKLMKRYEKVPTRFFVDLGDLADGMYYLRITTNFRSESFPVVLKK